MSLQVYGLVIEAFGDKFKKHIPELLEMLETSLNISLELFESTTAVIESNGDDSMNIDIDIDWELPHITRPYINLNRLETIEDFKELIKNLLKIDNSLIPDANYCSMFNDKVQELLKTESFKKIIKQIFDFSADSSSQSNSNDGWGPADKFDDNNSWNWESQSAAYQKEFETKSYNNYKASDDVNASDGYYNNDRYKTSDNWKKKAAEFEAELELRGTDNYNNKNHSNYKSISKR
ncbi:16799_t:CDS:2 [Entrophospora sp. SA101]|nr:16799_t:CDS:2 [Entrophospora sp. SA101]